MAQYGGINRLLVMDGQWWRLFIGPLLHGGPGHLIGNVFALVLGGLLLERRLGWRWILATFGGGALAGATASFLFNAPRVVSVGASGGITGMFAAAMVIAFRGPAEERGALLVLSGRLLIGALIPTHATGAVHIDSAAHAGGALGGLLLGLIAAKPGGAVDVAGRPQPFVLAACLAWIGATGVALTLDAFAYRALPKRQVAALSLSPLYRLPASARGTVPLAQLFQEARQGDTGAEDALKARALAGSAMAAAFVGNLYDPDINKGMATGARTRDAVKWYRMAAERGLPVAESNLGLLLDTNWPGQPADYPEALRWLQRVAPINVAASRELGIMYRDGHGVPRDPLLALKLIAAAAERGDLIAEKILANVYGTGGLPMDTQPAPTMRMLRLAAMHDNAEAERVIADRLLDGIGVTPDVSQAITWYARAAAHGDRKSQLLLKHFDPDAAQRTPPWGASKQTIEMTLGDNASAEQARCLEQRFSAPPTMSPSIATSFDEQKARSADLVLKFGRDARVRYARAAAMYDADRTDVAEVDLECAVDDQSTWYAYPWVQPVILTLLAKIELDKGNRDDARRIVAPVCKSKHQSIAALEIADLCEAPSGDAAKGAP